MSYYKIPEGEHFAPVSTSFFEDKRFSIEAKSIYAYLWTHAGILGQVAVTVDKICEDLNISRNRYYRHVSELRDKGYLTSKRVMSQTTGEFYNLYHLHDPFNEYNYGKKINDIRKGKFKSKLIQDNNMFDPEYTSSDKYPEFVYTKDNLDGLFD